MAKYIDLEANVAVSLSAEIWGKKQVNDNSAIVNQNNGMSNSVQEDCFVGNQKQTS